MSSVEDYCFGRPSADMRMPRLRGKQSSGPSRGKVAAGGPQRRLVPKGESTTKRRSNRDTGSPLLVLPTNILASKPCTRIARLALHACRVCVGHVGPVSHTTSAAVDLATAPCACRPGEACFSLWTMVNLADSFPCTACGAAKDVSRPSGTRKAARRLSEQETTSVYGIVLYWKRPNTKHLAASPSAA